MKPILHRPVRTDQASREQTGAQLRAALGKGYDLGAGARLLCNRIAEHCAGNSPKV
jgi:hypothetical protein